MLYFANPITRVPAVGQAMRDGIIGFIDTPAQGNKRPAGLHWCADNGCYSDRFNEARWWRFLELNAHDTDKCWFATAPDVVGNARATLKRSAPWLLKIRALGYPVAFVGQDGQENLPVPWDDFDVLFIGGTTDWKLGPGPRELCIQAHSRGKKIHLGRVNSKKRYDYGYDVLGAHSCDGTFLVFSPVKNLPRMLRWFRP